MKVMNKFYTRGLYMLLFLGMALMSFGQLGDDGTTNQDGTDGDDDSIFDTDIKGSPPRLDDDCYSLKTQDGSKLRLDFSFPLPGPVDLGNGRCDLALRITIAGIQNDYHMGALDQDTIVGSGEVVLSGTLEFPLSVVYDLISCKEGMMTIPIKFEFFCFGAINERMLTTDEVNDYFNINKNATSGEDDGMNNISEAPFSEIINVEFCCDYNDQSRMDLLIPNLPKNNAEFTINNNDRNYELVFDEYYKNKDIKIDIYDLVGKVLSTKNVTLGVHNNTISIEKPLNDSKIHIISIRTANQVKAKKVFNY